MSTSRPKSHVLTMLRQGGIVPVIRAESSAIALKSRRGAGRRRYYHARNHDDRTGRA